MKAYYAVLNNKFITTENCDEKMKIETWTNFSAAQMENLRHGRQGLKLLWIRQEVD